MNDYFPFWMFCSIVATCITWYKFKTRKVRNFIAGQGEVGMARRQLLLDAALVSVGFTLLSYGVTAFFIGWPIPSAIPAAVGAIAVIAAARL